MQNRFNFVGTLSFPKEDSKRPFYNSFTKNNRKMRTMNFAVKADTNMGFVELFGSEQNTIKVIDTDNNQGTVAWEDRFDEEVLAGVSNSSKYVISLGDEIGRKEFLSAFDAAEFIKENLPKVKDQLVRVSGRIVKNFYNGKVFDRYQLQNIYVVNEGSKDSKPKLRVQLELAYNKDSVDKDLWKDEKKVYLNAYTPTYIDKDHGTKYIAQRVCFNASKVDESIKEQVDAREFRMRFIDIPNKKMVRLSWDGYLINGAEEVSFDESQLTEVQREMVALGLKTVDDYRPRGQILGNRIQEYRLSNPNFNFEYKAGYVDMEMSLSEFEDDMVYIPPTEENLSDVLKTEKKEEPKKKEVEIDEDDLF